MKLHFVLVAGVLASAPAQANNELLILSEDEPSNSLVLDVNGSSNGISSLQAHNGFGAGNMIHLDIEGDFNGGAPGASFAGATLSLGLMPGSITQSGSDNHITASVTGSQNLFAFAQEGSGNRLTGSISGTANQVVVTQTGKNNVVGFSQSGIGNMINVSQTSW